MMSQSLMLLAEVDLDAELYRLLKLLIAICQPLLVIVLCVTGCGVAVPSDPQGTLERVRGDVLRAGASPSGTLVTVDGSLWRPIAKRRPYIISNFMPSGESVTGWLTFEIPAGAPLAQLLWRPSLDRTVAIDL